jgi:hypothetical protein
MSYDLQPCIPQVEVGRYLLVQLRPDLPPQRARTMIDAIYLTFRDQVANVMDLSHTTPEGLSQILAIPDSVIPTREQLEALHGERVVQEGLGL